MVSHGVQICGVPDEFTANVAVCNCMQSCAAQFALLIRQFKSAAVLSNAAFGQWFLQAPLQHSQNAS